MNLPFVFLVLVLCGVITAESDLALILMFFVLCFFTD